MAPARGGLCSGAIFLCLGRKVMTNLDSIFKSRDITLPTKVRLVKAMVFPVDMYGCESWTVKKAERRRINAFELCCWKRLWVPWTTRRSNRSVLKEISPVCLVRKSGSYPSSSYSILHLGKIWEEIEKQQRHCLDASPASTTCLLCVFFNNLSPEKYYLPHRVVLRFKWDNLHKAYSLAGT